MLVNLKARRGVLDRGVGELDDRLVDLAAQLHRLARARAQEVLVVVALELRELELEHAQSSSIASGVTRSLRV
jgi:hypothetical protein